MGDEEGSVELDKLLSPPDNNLTEGTEFRSKNVRCFCKKLVRMFYNKMNSTEVELEVEVELNTPEVEDEAGDEAGDEDELLPPADKTGT